MLLAPVVTLIEQQCQELEANARTARKFPNRAGRVSPCRELS